MARAKRITLLLAVLAVLAAATPVFGQSFMPNADFQQFWSGSWGHGVTTTNQIAFADNWVFGPGEGATAEFFRYPDEVILYWRNAPRWTSDPNDPSGGQTFIETGLSNMAVPLSGRRVRLEFSASTRWVDFRVAPILWVSWDTTTCCDYAIVSCPAVTLTVIRQTFTCELTVPNVGSRHVNTTALTSNYAPGIGLHGNYVGVGLDMMESPPAPFAVVLYRAAIYIVE